MFLGGKVIKNDCLTENDQFQSQTCPPFPNPRYFPTYQEYQISAFNWTPKTFENLHSSIGNPIIFSKILTIQNQPKHNHRQIPESLIQSSSSENPKNIFPSELNLNNIQIKLKDLLNPQTSQNQIPQQQFVDQIRKNFFYGISPYFFGDNIQRGEPPQILLQQFSIQLKNILFQNINVLNLEFLLNQYQI